jgi:hypothetical protein
MSGEQPGSGIEGIHVAPAEDRLAPEAVEQLEEKRRLAAARRSFQQEDRERRIGIGQKSDDIPWKIGGELPGARDGAHVECRK